MPDKTKNQIIGLHELSSSEDQVRTSIVQARRFKRGKPGPDYFEAMRAQKAHGAQIGQ